MVHHTCT